jgi:hypothetical protein
MRQCWSSLVFITWAQARDSEPGPHTSPFIGTRHTTSFDTERTRRWLGRLGLLFRPIRITRASNSEHLGVQAGMRKPQLTNWYLPIYSSIAIQVQAKQAISETKRRGLADPNAQSGGAELASLGADRADCAGFADWQAMKNIVLILRTATLPPIYSPLYAAL